MAIGSFGVSPSDNWVLISSVTSTAVTEIKFQSISGYRKLMVMIISGGFASAARPLLRLNNDSTSNNYAHVAFAQQPNTGVDNLVSYGTTNFDPFAGATANSGFHFQAIIDSADTTGVKTCLMSARFTNSGNSASYTVMNNLGFYRASAAITEVNLVSSSPNWNTTSTIALYGVRV